MINVSEYLMNFEYYDRIDLLHLMPSGKKTIIEYVKIEEQKI